MLAATQGPLLLSGPWRARASGYCLPRAGLLVFAPRASTRVLSPPSTPPGCCRAPTLSIQHFAPLSAALNPLTLCMCSCFSPAQRFQLHFETAGRSRSTVLSARSSTTVVIIVGAARRHAPAAAGMKLFGTTAKWTRYERTMSPPLERIPCSPACHRAPSWLAGCPTLRRGKSVPHTRTTGLLERRAPLRPPMWQDASS